MIYDTYTNMNNCSFKTIFNPFVNKQKQVNLISNMDANFGTNNQINNLKRTVMILLFYVIFGLVMKPLLFLQHSGQTSHLSFFFFSSANEYNTTVF